jgi:hypothetical protein
MGKLMLVCDSVSLPILFEVDGGGVEEQGWGAHLLHLQPPSIADIRVKGTPVVKACNQVFGASKGMWYCGVSFKFFVLCLVSDADMQSLDLNFVETRMDAGRS